MGNHLATSSSELTKANPAIYVYAIDFIPILWGAGQGGV
jgi:hypothetical protein